MILISQIFFFSIHFIAPFLFFFLFRPFILFLFFQLRECARFFYANYHCFVSLLIILGSTRNFFLHFYVCFVGLYMHSASMFEYTYHIVCFSRIATHTLVLDNCLKQEFEAVCNQRMAKMICKEGFLASSLNNPLDNFGSNICWHQQEYEMQFCNNPYIYFCFYNNACIFFLYNILSSCFETLFGVIDSAIQVNHVDSSLLIDGGQGKSSLFLRNGSYFSKILLSCLLGYVDPALAHRFSHTYLFKFIYIIIFCIFHNYHCTGKHCGLYFTYNDTQIKC